MTILDKVNEYFGLLGTTFGQLFSWQVWKFVAPFFLLYGILLFAQYDSMSPWFFGAVTAWNSSLTMFFGWIGLSDSGLVAYTHYPAHFILLGTYFGWTKLIVGVLLEGLVFGLVANAFARKYYKSKGEEAFSVKRVLSRWPQLLLAWLTVNILLIVIGSYLPGLLGDLLDGPRRVIAFRFVVLPFTYLIVFSMFYFVFPLVVLFRRSFIGAVLDSFRLFFRRPFTCFFLSAFAMIFPILISTSVGYSTYLVQQFNPEVVFWLLSIGLVAEMFSMFFWMSTSVRFLADHY